MVLWPEVNFEEKQLRATMRWTAEHMQMRFSFPGPGIPERHELKEG